MAKIVTITNPLTGQPAQVDQLDHTAQQIDDGLNIARGVSNPNLLDNWYFGNPVDQRQGRVVKPNTTYYSDNQLTTSAGTTSSYVTAYRYTTGTASGVSYASFKLTDSNSAPTYYAAPENVVRGYTGAWVYTVDRYIVYGTNPVVLIEDDGLKIIGSGDVSLHINIDPSVINIGQSHTLSVLVSELNGSAMMAQWATPTPELRIGVNTLTFVAHENTWQGTSVVYNVNGSVKIKAAKLELGPQQTLAHQDANGNWVLNELPNYADTLARCQRYQLVFDNSISGFASLGQALILNSTTISAIIPTPVTVRNVGESGPVVISDGCRLRFIFTVGNGALAQDIKPKSAGVVAASQTSVILNILFDPISIPANTTGYCDLISGKIIIDRNM